jgi:SAM-dependent methyltransferase
MKAFAPAADRNKEPILDVLRRVLPARGVVLELASGSGQHSVHFAATLPALTFRPSDPSPEARESIAAWVAESNLPNVEAPRAIDVTVPGWELERVDAILCINMIHISPWASTLALFRGAARCLGPGAPLVLYGPYRFHGDFLAPSNAAFDDSLRGRDPEWGVRDVDDIDAVAENAGFSREETIAMPANNHVLVYRRRV